MLRILNIWLEYNRKGSHMPVQLSNAHNARPPAGTYTGS